MKNLHSPVMLKEIISFIPNDRPLNVVDATFGGGGYSKAILENFKVTALLAIDRDPISNLFSKNISSKYSNFSLINDKFSNIDKIVQYAKLDDKKFDIILYDLGTSSNQIDNSERGFSFKYKGLLDMRMGLSDNLASQIVNNYDEKKLANIIFEYGEEKYSRKIAREIVKNRKIKAIDNTIELSELIKKTIPNK